MNERKHKTMHPATYGGFAAARELVVELLPSIESPETRALVTGWLGRTLSKYMAGLHALCEVHADPTLMMELWRMHFINKVLQFAPGDHAWKLQFESLVLQVLRTHHRRAERRRAKDHDMDRAVASVAMPDVFPFPGA